ncbi:MAG: glycosyltransferase family 39 protein [Phycisphaerae bacterium]
MNTRTLTLIILAALIVRLALLAGIWNDGVGGPRGGQPRYLMPDSEGYIKLAASLADSARFAMDDKPEIFRTPGYSLLLTFGAPFGQSWWRAVIVLQILLDVATVYLAFLLGWMMVGQRAGLWAAALQAFSPLAIAASNRILSDTAFAFLLAWTLVLLVFHLKSRRLWPLIAAAVFLGAACYVRPVGLAMAAVCAAVLLADGLVQGRKRRGAEDAAETRDRQTVRRARRALGPAAAFGGIVILCVAPWVVRNGLAAQYWGFSSFAGDGAYFFAVPELISATEGVPAATAREMMKREDQRDNEGLSPGAAARARRSRVWQAIGEHPWLYAKIHLKGCWGFFLPGATDLLEMAGLTAGNAGTVDVLHREGLAAAVKHYFDDRQWAMLLAVPLAAVPMVLYAGVLLCIVRRLSWRMPAEVWLLAAIVIVAMLLPGPFGLPRYRLPVLPVLGVAAGAGLTSRKKPASPPAKA